MFFFFFDCFATSLSTWVDVTSMCIYKGVHIYIYITYTYQQINSACSRYSAAQTAAVCKCNGNYYILCKPNTCLYSLMQKEYLSLYIYIYIYIYGDSFRCQGVLGPWLVQS